MRVKSKLLQAPQQESNVLQISTLISESIKMASYRYIMWQHECKNFKKENNNIRLYDLLSRKGFSTFPHISD